MTVTAMVTSHCRQLTLLNTGLWIRWQTMLRWLLTPESHNRWQALSNDWWPQKAELKDTLDCLTQTLLGWLKIQKVDCHTPLTVIRFWHPVNHRITSGWSNSVISNAHFKTFLIHVNPSSSQTYKIYPYTDTKQNTQTSNTNCQELVPSILPLFKIFRKPTRLGHAGITYHSVRLTNIR